jgi:hypothetical protein
MWNIIDHEPQSKMYIGGHTLHILIVSYCTWLTHYYYHYLLLLQHIVHDANTIYHYIILPMTHTLHTTLLEGHAPIHAA